MLACRLDLQWDKGRLFDQEVAQLYQHLLAQAGQLRVISVAETESRKHRPHGEICMCSVASALCVLGRGGLLRVLRGGTSNPMKKVWRLNEDKCWAMSLHGFL